MLNDIIVFLSSVIWSWPFVIFLFCTHIFLTFKLGFPQFKVFKLFRKNKKALVENKKSSISSFAGLMTIVGATIGMGNIVGVAEAIKSAGKGVIFWIFVAGFFAIATKYAETYIVLKYRETKKDGSHYGGAMYVLDNVLGKKHLAKLFAIFTIIASLGIGAMIQSNSLANLLNDSLNVPKIAVAILLCIISIYIMFGGEKRLAKLSEYIIPICAILFVISNVAIIIISKCDIISLFNEVLQEAFNINAIFAGTSTYIFLHMLNKGLSTGLFSNEAGMGSSPIFTASVDSEDYVKEAYIASISTTIDTVILCTLTGFALLSTGIDYTTISATMYVKEVFSTIPFGQTLLNISIIVFVVSCIPCFFYYAKSAVNYLVNHKNGYSLIYSVLYLVSIFVGCNIALNLVWELSGIANALMVIPNIFMVFALLKEIKT